MPYVWQTAAHSPVLDLGGGSTSTLSALIAPGPSGDWLIAGTRTSGSGAKTATVWTSPDGVKWSRFALPKPTGVTSTSALAATNWGDREVVVGSAGTGAAMTAVVWESQGQGQPFVAVPATPVFQAPAANGQQVGAMMDAVAAGALGLFASGTVNGRTTMWYSTAGQRWQTLSGADGVIDHYRGAVVNDILSTPGGIYAAGSFLDGNRLSGELWSSSDGIHWSSAGGWFAGAGDRVVTSLVDMSESGNAEPGSPGPTGMLAVGGVRVGATWQPASWISPNGASWSESSESFPLDDEPSGTPGALVYAAAGADGRLLSVGGSPSRQRVWQSSAGLAWSALALPPAATNATDWHLGLVAASGHTVVVADNLPGQPYVLTNDGSKWHQPSAGGIFGAPLHTAVPTNLVGPLPLTMSVQISDPGQRLGTGNTSVAVLSSSNGSVWHMVSAHAFRGATVNEVSAVPDGLLAVGSVPVSGAQAQSGGRPDWTGAFARLSTDGGASWHDQLINPATLGGPGPEGPGVGTSSPEGPAGTGAAATTAAAGAAGIGTAVTTTTAVSPASTGAAATTTTTTGPTYLFGPLAAVSAGRVGDSQYVVGQAGAQAVDWFSPDGNTWEAPRPLDPSPQLGTEQVTASCTAGDSAVVVGSITTTARGRLPAAWRSTDGSSWTAGIFAPTPSPGSSTTVDGCLATGDGFIAYGETGNTQVERPVLWQSSDGINWQVMGSTFTGLASTGPLGIQAAPLDYIVWGTSTWIGLSGHGDLPWQVWPAPIGGAAGAEVTPAGLWSSTNAGDTWQQMATGIAPFTGSLFVQVDAATFVGQQPVIAGAVDGRLTVWVGTPAPTGAAATTTTAAATTTTHPTTTSTSGGPDA